MEFPDEYAVHLAEWWARRGREMPETNLKQAEHPAGAELGQLMTEGTKLTDSLRLSRG